MTTNATRSAIDIGPSRPGTGLALLLGILSVLRSTVAWDLPAGGLWIGLPLRHRRDRRRRQGPPSGGGRLDGDCRNRARGAAILLMAGLDDRVRAELTRRR